MKSCDIHLREVSQKTFRRTILDMHLKITYLKLQPHLQGPNELIAEIFLTEPDPGVVEDDSWFDWRDHHSGTHRHVLLVYRNHQVSTFSLNSHERHGVSNSQQLDCLFNCLLGKQQRKHQSSALLVVCEGNRLVNIWCPSQRASNAEISMECGENWMKQMNWNLQY